jgi:hypothetical protein
MFYIYLLAGKPHRTLYGDAPWTIASVHRYLADG